MKINQFATIPTNFDQQVKELINIRFIDENSLSDNPIQLFRRLLQKTFINMTGESDLNEKLSTYQANLESDLKTYLDENSELDINVFYNVSLQLLEFNPDVDFTFSKPLEAMKTIQLKIVDHQSQYLSTNELISAWYWLLTTHNKFGQMFIDKLASQGYFVPFYNLDNYLYFNGKSMPVFDPNEAIREIVYVESNQDSDLDGKLDLLKVEIIRPKTSQKVPTLYTASPYNQGTNDETGDKLMHNVNIPLAHKEPTETSYEDIEYKVTDAKLPAPRKINGQTDIATQTFSRESSYTMNDYFLARGFAVAYSAGIGTKDSDGFRTTGDKEETISTIATIEWLAGNRVAFTNRTDNIAIEANWSNHKVAMTGRSYLGTLATAAATTGVEGLETIISEAAISSWYDYYRENGLVIAPGGFPGEDADVLAEETFSRRLQPGDFLKIKNNWENQLQSITDGQDRLTGNYNEFWDARNYRKDLKNIKADVFMVHGLNDWNVKPTQVEKLYQGLNQLGIKSKLILHQGEHIYINNFQSFDYTDIINLWLSNKLLEQQNNAQEVLPPVIIQDNVKPETWNKFDSWASDKNEIKNFYLQPDKLSSEKSSEVLSFNDQLPSEKFDFYTKNIATWQNDLINSGSNYNNRLVFKTDPLKEDLVIDGNVNISLEVSSSENVGLISAQLMDYGEARRLNITPSLIAKNRLSGAYNWREDDLREFTLGKTAKYKMITKGHINLQNRKNSFKNDELNAGKRYQISLQLQPTMYRIPKGRQLGLVIYATDFGMTVRGNQDITYSISLNNSSISIPIHK
ncbi:Xaa-Pro dipeptidyl-peptidase [Companilactobacillus metriopterae]|uniref:Xaa-Pro dipeptidyl-peptidase n=1 Tax=Companilactobacillus metriopterae TaxID=1909267 RepID=UPI00100A87B0|nr:Xaa-Pro dipeptidyl-peptidase [Companilactobacillus metriopterae]